MKKANDYRLNVQLHHVKVGFLDKLKDLRIVAKQRLAEDIHRDEAYANAAAAIVDGPKMGTFGMQPGHTCEAYFSRIPDNE